MKKQAEKVDPVAEQAQVNFEEAMQQLENIVSELERGDVPLEKAIDLFQQGMQLSQLCGQKLAEVERKIEMIVEEDGEISKQPFQPPLGEPSDF